MSQAHGQGKSSPLPRSGEHKEAFHEPRRAPARSSLFRHVLTPAAQRERLREPRRFAPPPDKSANATCERGIQPASPEPPAPHGWCRPKQQETRPSPGLAPRKATPAGDASRERLPLSRRLLPRHITKSGIRRADRFPFARLRSTRLKSEPILVKGCSHRFPPPASSPHRIYWG